MMTLRIALRALLRNKMRSFLTMLGIIIGVAAVIAMVAIGEGAKAQVVAQFAAMGTNLLIVMPGSTSAGGVAGGYGSSSTITWDDLQAIRTELDSVKAAAPNVRVTAQMVSDEQNWSAPVIGTTPDFFEVRSWPVTKGVPLNESDVTMATKVVVLGATTSARLFGEGVDPTGRTVRIRNIPFEVVGLAARKGQSPTGQDYDDTAFIPATTMQRRIQGGLQRYLSGIIYVAARSSEEVPLAIQQVSGLLRDRHAIGPGQEDDFSVRNLAETQAAQAASTETMTMLLASVAAVSLLVGGIGIMNIMLVSVTERTREIGIRMAIGAKPWHVLAQFLTESLTLGVLGGLLGIALGIGSARYIATHFQWSVLIRMDVALIAVVFSALVGVVFGLYPARKASRLDPIQALRFE